MAAWQEKLGQLRQRWDALDMRWRVVAIVAVAALVGVSLLALTRHSEPEMAVLFARLDPDNAAQVTERLQTLGVEHKVTDGGTTVLVPEEEVHPTRLTLASEGLPGGGDVGFELFDEQKFGESEFSEQVKYHRALEGELSRTISHLQGVKHARVHLVMPQRSVFLDESDEASASVALQMKPGWRIRDAQVEGIVHLVAASVTGLKPEHVTVVDGKGQPLGRGKRDGEEANQALAYRKEIEQARERSIQQLLDQALGKGRAVARVAAELDLSQQEHTEEKYEPETVATRSFEIIEESGADGAEVPQGIPGAASNLPGGEAPTSARSGSGSRRRSETRNFEVSKRTVHAIEAVGRLKRLHVAVIVDGHWSTTKKGKRKYKARSKDELKRIKAIVAGAAGIDAERGDQIAVECVPFAQQKDGKVETGHPLLTQLLPYWPYAAAAAGALLLLLVVLVLLITRGRRKKKEVETEAAARPATHPVDLLLNPEQGAAASLAGEPSPEQLAAGEGGHPALASGEKSPAQEADELQKMAAELAAEDVIRSARVLRGWIGAQKS
ncbi:MAG: flagellar basal-body MS-ring/collar protein FliF [Polyangiales bacterium]